MRHLLLFVPIALSVVLGCDIERIPPQTPPQTTQRPEKPYPPQTVISPLRPTRAEDQPTTYQDPLEQAQQRTPTPRSSRSIRPVYHERHLPPHPHAQQLCAALHTLPAKRKQTCCRERAFGYLVTPECIRTLSIALHQKTVTLDTSALSACAQAIQQAHQGCAWVGPWPPPTPTACLSLLRGTRPQGQPCRSSLECLRPLHCHNLGPTQSGRCAPPQPHGTPCGAAPDPLAVYTRQDNTETEHPTCQGYCRRFRCRTHHTPHSSCSADIQCTKGHSCNGHRCIQGQPNTEQARCSGRCASPLRCVKGRCIRPKPQGSPCLSSLECLGACEIPDGQTLGRCAIQCLHPLLRPYKHRPSTSHTSPASRRQTHALRPPPSHQQARILHLPTSRPPNHALRPPPSTLPTTPRTNRPPQRKFSHLAPKKR